MNDRIFNVMGMPRLRDGVTSRASPRFVKQVVPPPKIPDEVIQRARGIIGKVEKPATTLEASKIEQELVRGTVKQSRSTLQGGFRLWPSSWVMEVGVVTTDNGSGTYEIPFKNSFSSIPYFYRTSWGYTVIDLGFIKFRIPLFTFITNIKRESFDITYFFGKERYTSYMAIGPL